jgi:pilus assembly protein CpaE
MDVAAPGTVEVGQNAGASTAMVFVRDRDSEGVIRQCLSDLAVVTCEFQQGGVEEAITELASRPSPRLLIVDVRGVEEPVARIRELANVCDPSTGVVVIGDANDIRLYRELKAAGIVEYYYTPLVRALIMQSCNAIMTGSTAQLPSRTGKLIFVVGVRGGAGATTIAVATAWHFAQVNKRRVSLLDLDLQFGDTALQLDAVPSHALVEALDHPERVDELFLDRGIAHASERLGVMAALEPLNETLIPDEPAVLLLLERLLRRSRYVLVEIPVTSAPHLMQALHLPGTVLLVSGGSLVCARDVARLRAKFGPNSAERSTIHILNKSGAGESLSEEEFARAVGTPPDIVLPFLNEIAIASRLGVQGLEKCAPLQRALMPLYSQLSGEEPVAPLKWRLSSLFRSL